MNHVAPTHGRTIQNPSTGIGFERYLVSSEATTHRHRLQRQQKRHAACHTTGTFIQVVLFTFNRRFPFPGCR